MTRRESALFGFGILTGLALGAVAGLLFAPSSGEVTRRRIADSAESAWENAGRAVESSERIVNMISGRVEEMLNLEERNVRRKLEELRADIEKLTPSKAQPRTHPAP